MDGLYGGIELGGTKIICGIGRQDGSLIEHSEIYTTTIEETIPKVIDFFKSHPISALGVGSFGPLNINQHSPDYGSIYNSPKAGWNNVNLDKLLREGIKSPIKYDLDVNCAALGEMHYGAAQECNNFVYITVGTGIGGGLIIDKKIVHGIKNLEMGHVRIPHDNFVDGFKGTCPMHGDCLEGIASGYALQQRYGKPAESLDNLSIWEEEANHLALAINNIVMSFGPDRIIIGGGVMQKSGLIGQIQKKVFDLVNGYLELPALDRYIVKASTDFNAVQGAIKLAQDPYKAI